MFQAEVVEKIKTQILRSIKCFRKSCPLRDNVENYCTARQATHDNTARAHCILGTQVYKNTLTIRNTY